ncbi:TPA: hypothetical protein ACG3IG_003829 [Clostridioides difficile]
MKMMQEKIKIKIYLEGNNVDEAYRELLREFDKLDGIVEGQKLEIISLFNINDFSLEQKMQILHKLLELRVVFKFKKV